MHMKRYDWQRRGNKLSAISYQRSAVSYQQTAGEWNRILN